MGDGLRARWSCRARGGEEQSARKVEELVIAEMDADFEYARVALPQALQRSLSGDRPRFVDGL